MTQPIAAVQKGQHSEGLGNVITVLWGGLENFTVQKTLELVLQG